MIYGASVPNFNRINEWPLQFLRTGYYDRSDGYLAARTTRGYWWSNTASSATDGRYLGTRTDYINAQYGNWRGHGFALRCVTRMACLMWILLALMDGLVDTKRKTPDEGRFWWVQATSQWFCPNYPYCNAETEQSQAFCRILAKELFGIVKRKKWEKYITR